MTVGMFGQEFGWRGYLQPRLFTRNPMLAAVTTGLISGFWLVLITWRAYRLSGPATQGLLIIPLVTICLSIVLGWVQAKTNNIWVPSLLHGSIIAAGGSLVIAPVYVKALTVTISPLGMWSLIPLGCLCLWVLVSCYRAAKGIN